MKLNVVVITSSRGPISSASTAKRSASVPEATPTPWAQPQYQAASCPLQHLDAGSEDEIASLPNTLDRAVDLLADGAVRLLQVKDGNGHGSPAEGTL